MFMDICKHGKTLLVRIFPVLLKCDFSDFNHSWVAFFYKMRVSLENC